MKLKERTIWIGITAFSLAIIILLSFSPGALAGERDSESQTLLELFYEVFYFIQDNYVDEEKLDSNNLIEGALQGMFEALDDPYSTYLTSKDMRSMNDTTTGRFGGVGLIISKVEKGVQVVSPIEDTPAYKAGISAGDLIIAVEGASVVDSTIDEVVNVLRGEPDTAVKVTILRGKRLTFDVTIIRALIEVPTVKQALIPGGIGYLRIIQFTPLTPFRVKEALAFFEENQYKGLIVDLRSNPGGLLDSVVKISDMFISRGPIVSTRSRVVSENQIFPASRKATIVDRDIPVVVLIDRGSASASEILAGALKDTKRATLLGEKSYGKGSVQQIRKIGDGGFKLTMSRYYTPSGVTIDKVGIMPDKEIKEPELTEEEEESFSRLLNEELVKDFVSRNNQLGERAIASFIEELRGADIDLPDRYIRKLIRIEVNRTNNSPPVYDLEYDLVLREAVQMLK
jgi:carboxyl-terminal processing protease